MTVTSRADMEWKLLLCGSPAGSFLRKKWVRLHSMSTLLLSEVQVNIIQSGVLQTQGFHGQTCLGNYQNKTEFFSEGLP